MIPFYNSSGSSFFSSFSSSFERSKSFPIFSAFLALVSIKSKEFSDMMSIFIACSLTSEMRYLTNGVPFKRRIQFTDTKQNSNRTIAQKKQKRRNCNDSP